MYMNSLGSLQNMSANVIEYNTYKHITEVVNGIKAFYGDLFGAFVYNWRVLGLISNVTIQFRLDTIMLPILLNILSLRFRVADEDAYSGQFPLYFGCTLLPLEENSHLPIKLRAVLIGKKAFRISTPNFDINMLTEDDCAMYVRNHNTANMRYIIDKLTYLKERICLKTFSAVQRFYVQRILNDIGNANEITTMVEDAIDLINQGWTMDDRLIGTEAWIVTKWGLFLNRPHKYRTTLNTKKLASIIENNQCSLCQEQFDDDSIVINTACHHSFHWICHSDVEGLGKSGGLKAWVENTSSRQCCPCCRSFMF